MICIKKLSVLFILFSSLSVQAYECVSQNENAWPVKMIKKGTLVQLSSSSKLDPIEIDGIIKGTTPVYNEVKQVAVLECTYDIDGYEYYRHEFKLLLRGMKYHGKDYRQGDRVEYEKGIFGKIVKGTILYVKVEDLHVYIETDSGKIVEKSIYEFDLI